VKLYAVWDLSENNMGVGQRWNRIGHKLWLKLGDGYTEVLDTVLSSSVYV
jgi:hypothetical protein